MPTQLRLLRRGYRAAAAAAAVAASKAGARRKVLDGTPAALGFRMPAEWEPHDQCWIGWPDAQGFWRDAAAPAQKAFANVVDAISRFEPVTVCCNATQYARVAHLMEHKSNVRVVEMSACLVWLRDLGPSFVVREGDTRLRREIAGVDWQYNAYGGYNGLFGPEDHQLNRRKGHEEHITEDNLVARKVLELERIPRFETNFVLEGGSIHVDGEGRTCITTEQCLCHGNRNPHMSKDEIENQLKTHLGVSKVIWLPKGLYGDEMISGHVDNICCFTGPSTVLLSWIDDKSDPQYEHSAAAFDVLSNTTDAKGRKLDIIKIHVPGPLCMTEEVAQPFLGSVALGQQRLAGSYVNFYIANGGVVAPAFGDKWDEEARKILEKVFPKHEVVMVEGGREIVLGGGNIHCATQQQPAVCPHPSDADTM
uniref:Agmatine deiminase n=1 Tax=Aegilops tauschii subsp. strangulata TaxID=200361 RepID=A0A453KPX7_AEGTS